MFKSFFLPLKSLLQLLGGIGAYFNATRCYLVLLNRQFLADCDRESIFATLTSIMNRSPAGETKKRQYGTKHFAMSSALRQPL